MAVTLYCPSCRTSHTSVETARPPYAALHTADGHRHPITRTLLGDPDTDSNR